MREKSIFCLLASISATIFLAGCASTPKQNTESEGAVAVSGKQKFASADALLTHDDVKGKSPLVYQQPLDKTHEAALRALSFVGCEVKVQEPYYVAGRRPNKFGLFVGSGGETVEVFMYPQGPNETHVWVDTDLSFVGIAGQQAWDKQVVSEMTNLLSKQTTSP